MLRGITMLSNRRSEIRMFRNRTHQSLGSPRAVGISRCAKHFSSEVEDQKSALPPAELEYVKIVGGGLSPDPGGCERRSIGG